MRTGAVTGAARDDAEGRFRRGEAVGFVDEQLVAWGEPRATLEAVLEELGREADAASAVVEDVRRRDIARLIMQKAEGIMGGADMLHGARLTPQPLTDPRKRAHGLSEETRDIIGEDGEIR